MIELFAGLHGWGEGAIAEGFRVIGFDIVNMGRELGIPRSKGIDLVLQDVTTLHGAQFRDAALIIASPPCQAYSYRAMPWKRAKALGPPDNTLFEACFRIQREAEEAAGRHIPLVVENVCGAQKWVGRARWHYGSFYLWGDVPALMPIVRKCAKVSMPPGQDSLTIGFQQMAKLQMQGVKVPTMGAGWYPPGQLQDRATKNAGGSWFNVAHNTTSGHGQNPTHRQISEGWRSKHYENTENMRIAGSAVEETGIKQGGDWFNDSEPSISRLTGSKISARKAASAHIAKIPLPLARHIARAWKPAEAR